MVTREALVSEKLLALLYPSAVFEAAGRCGVDSNDELWQNITLKIAFSPQKTLAAIFGLTSVGQENTFRKPETVLKVFCLDDAACPNGCRPRHCSLYS